MKSNRNVSIAHCGVGPAASFEIWRVGRAALGALALLGSASAGAAPSDFTGPFSLPHWTVSSTLGPPSVGTFANAGWVDTTLVPTSLILYGPNDPALFDPGPPSDFDFTITVPHGGRWSFTWVYNSDDLAGYDNAGWLLNGVYTPLSDIPGTSGGFSIAVQTGDVIGYRVHSIDSTGGVGYLTIANFAMPEPSTLPLLALGAAGIFTARRRVRLAGLVPR